MVIDYSFHADLARLSSFDNVFFVRFSTIPNHRNYADPYGYCFVANPLCSSIILGTMDIEVDT